MLSPFKAALIAIQDKQVAARVEKALKAWSRSKKWKQIVRNVEAEISFVPGRFSSFLHAFGKKLLSVERVAAWEEACYGNQLMGFEVPHQKCEHWLLGRIKTVKAHATAVSEASQGKLTAREAWTHLVKGNNTVELDQPFRGFLFTAQMGRDNRIIWATLNPKDPTHHPLTFLPFMRGGLLNLLGLKHIPDSHAIIFLTWSHKKNGHPPLHRPTVADAGTMSSYRPCSDPKSLWGETEPVRKVERLERCPEIVLSGISSAGLQLPYRIF